MGEIRVEFQEKFQVEFRLGEIRVKFQVEFQMDFQVKFQGQLEFARIFQSPIDDVIALRVRGHNS